MSRIYTSQFWIKVIWGYQVFRHVRILGTLVATGSIHPEYLSCSFLFQNNCTFTTIFKHFSARLISWSAIFTTIRQQYWTYQEWSHFIFRLNFSNTGNTMLIQKNGPKQCLGVVKQYYVCFKSNHLAENYRILTDIYFLWINMHPFHISLFVVIK